MADSENSRLSNNRLDDNFLLNRSHRGKLYNLFFWCACVCVRNTTLGSSARLTHEKKIYHSSHQPARYWAKTRTHTRTNLCAICHRTNQKYILSQPQISLANERSKISSDILVMFWFLDVASLGQQQRLLKLWSLSNQKSERARTTRAKHKYFFFHSCCLFSFRVF